MRASTLQPLTMTSYFISAVLFIDLATSTRHVFRWSYEEENKWPGEKCNGGGDRQSPIDIKTSAAIRDFDMKFIKYGDLLLTGYQKVLLTATNNEYTIMFRTDGEPEIHPTVTGGPLRWTYRLEQLHLHWLSEHAIDGNKYPVEIHFVHVRSDLNAINALKKRDGLAILALFCKISEHEEQTESIFDDLADAIAGLGAVGSQINGVVLNLSQLFSPNTSVYYTYAGSLTSPTCNEVVTWIIFPEPIYITESQYNLVEKVREGRYNSRSLQPLRQQQVFQPPTELFTEPHFVTTLKNTLFSIVQFFSKISSFMFKGLETTSKDDERIKDNSR